MSALAMILMAAMAVPASGPEKVSGEAEQKLDLSGEWEGTWQSGSDNSKSIWDTRIRDGRFTAKWRSASGSKRWGGVDEGKRKLRLDGGYLGIYKWKGNRLFICYQDDAKGYPLAFHPEKGQHLLILRRVKPRK